MWLDHFSLSIAIDLGTTNTLAAVPGKGVVFDEPTVIARLKKRPGVAPKLVAFGKKAKRMIGRQPQTIEVIEPLRSGVIADFDAAVALLSYLVDFVSQLPSRWPRLIKPKAVIGVPSGVTEVEKRAVRTAAEAAGISRVFLIEEPMAAAVGIGLVVDKPVGNLLMDFGGGTTEIAIISLGGIVLHRCLKIGGREMDEAIINFIRLKHGVLVGQSTAEKIKIKIGSVASLQSNRQLAVRGRDLETGLPKSIEINEPEVREALSPIMQEIIANLNELLEEAPPELTTDISRRGIVLTGGCSQLRGMEKIVAEATKMPVWTAGDPREGVVRGGVKLLENEKLLKQMIISR